MSLVKDHEKVLDKIGTVLYKILRNLKKTWCDQHLSDKWKFIF